jgi:hypothetical protein
LRSCPNVRPSRAKPKPNHHETKGKLSKLNETAQAPDYEVCRRVFRSMVPDLDLRVELGCNGAWSVLGRLDAVGM